MRQIVRNIKQHAKQPTVLENPRLVTMELPLLVLCEFFSFLERQKLAAVRAVCREWCGLVDPILFCTLDFDFSRDDAFSVQTVARHGAFMRMLNVNYTRDPQAFSKARAFAKHLTGVRGLKLHVSNLGNPTLTEGISGLSIQTLSAYLSSHWPDSKVTWTVHLTVLFLYSCTGITGTMLRSIRCPALAKLTFN